MYSTQLMWEIDKIIHEAKEIRIVLIKNNDDDIIYAIPKLVNQDCILVTVIDNRAKHDRLILLDKIISIEVVK